ncbi:(2R)-3-sulfolactate dehydrogenase (NADP+) [Rhodococcus sp. 27YEA15]|uniref:Ldh family oxidoreductase n=1 Tax=Rhodococcus sp. 27YEA15 TaxID=3156259 RepID=UPI003C7D3979
MVRSTSRVQVSAGDATETIAAALSGDTADADVVATAAVWADLSGWQALGTDLLAREMARSNADEHQASTRRSATTCAVDANGQVGPMALALACRLAGDSAVAAGVGVTTMTGLTGTGRLAPYVAAIADRGLIGVIALQSPPVVAPFGGTGRAIGTNPLAFAAPRDSEKALVVDLATASMSLAELARYTDGGAELPVGTALDSDGVPTRVAEDVFALLPDGLTSSLVGLLVETLAGALGGQQSTDGGRGGFVLAIAPPDDLDLSTRIDEIAHRWHTAGGHVPGESVPLPTEREPYDPAARIDVDETWWQGLVAVSKTKTEETV